MNKKYIVLGVIGTLIVGGLVFMKFRSSSLDKTLKDVQQMKSYEFVSHMEMLENDELKSYQVSSTYASIDDHDYYKVELYDKSLNQAQVIVRNDEGVFVLTPSLNQAFQFKSDWPMNSPKPYIYQSLITFMQDNKAEKVKDGYLVSGKMTYENDQRVKNQEVKFDKTLSPSYVSVFDEDGTELIKLTTSSFKADIQLTKEDFMQDRIMKENKDQYKNVSSSLPLYPVALMGSTLENEKVSKINETTNHILKFTGDKAFTIVETVSASKDYDIEVIHEEVIDLIDGFAYQKENQMTYVSSGVVCSLYSHDLTKDEMLSVLSSMQSSQVK